MNKQSLEVVHFGSLERARTYIAEDAQSLKHSVTCFDYPTYVKTGCPICAHSVLSSYNEQSRNLRPKTGEKMSSGDGPSVEGNTQIVIVPERPKHSLPPLPLAPSNVGNAIVEYKKADPKDEDEDIELKLRRILDHIPVRVSNTSGSSAGSGSGDFHQYRQMRRKEQDRLARMEVDYQKRKELSDFSIRREERMKATEERTAKKRLKRQRKKMKKNLKKSRLNPDAGDQQKDESSEDEDKSDGDAGVQEIPIHIFVPAGERVK